METGASEKTSEKVSRLKVFEVIRIAVPTMQLTILVTMYVMIIVIGAAYDVTRPMLEKFIPLYMCTFPVFTLIMELARPSTTAKRKALSSLCCVVATVVFVGLLKWMYS
jgi:hypothetical protein